MSEENTKAKKTAEKATKRAHRATAASSLSAVLAALDEENARRHKIGKAPLSYGKFVAQLENR